ncbi:C2 family cysteine protease [Burkholderia sp. AW33-5]
MVDLANLNSISRQEFQALTASQIQGITDSALGILDSNHYQWLLAGQLAAMNTGQIAALKHPEWLTSTAVKGLTAAQIPSINTSWSALTAAWFNSLASTAFSAIPVSAFGQISMVTLRGLDAAHVGALTGAQLAAIDASGKKVVSSLTAAQVGELNVSSMTIGEVRSLSRKQVAGLTATQLSTKDAKGLTVLASLASWQISGLVISALSTAQVQSLTANQVGGLTEAQLGATDSNGKNILSDLTTAQVQGLTSSQAGMLTAAQLGAADANGHTVLSDLSATQYSGVNPYHMTTAQVQSLTSNQVASLNIAQLSAIDDQGHVAMLDLLATAQPSYLTKSQLSYSSVLSALQAFAKTIGANGMSSAQLTEFDAFVTAVKTIDGASSYVGSLLNSMNHGGLKAGSSASDFNALTDKWFLGADNPTALSGDHLASKKSSPLFPENIANAYQSVHQGYYDGDCYLVAALIETAAVDPAALKSMISENANGTYSVRFYNPTGVGYVTVDSELPTYTGAFDSDGTIWAGLIEKAYIEAQANGIAYSMGGGNSYNTIANGGWDAPLKSFTGKSTNYAGLDSVATLSAGGTTYTAVSATLAAHEDVLFASNRGAEGLVGGHMYACIGIDASNEDYILVNPWGGGNERVELSAAQLNTLNSAGDCFLLSNGQGPADNAGAAGPVHAQQLVQAMASLHSPAQAAESGLLHGQYFNSNQPILAHAH